MKRWFVWDSDGLFAAFLVAVGDEYNRERPHRALGMRATPEAAAEHGID